MTAQSRRAYHQCIHTADTGRLSLENHALNSTISSGNTDSVKNSSQQDDICVEGEWRPSLEEEGECLFVMFCTLCLQFSLSEYNNVRNKNVRLYEQEFVDRNTIGCVTNSKQRK